MTESTPYWLPLLGFVAGFIDSIAGGGGLITLPAFTLLLGAGAPAIGTNKIAAVTASLAALLVYLRRGHVAWKTTLVFALVTGLGSFVGSRIAPLIPSSAFESFLFVTCPLILLVIWKKDLWISHSLPTVDGAMGPGADSSVSVQSRLAVNPHSATLIAVCGFACGLYDGVWGPGGGTFMFLSLLIVAKLPLLTAMATAKFANLSSALFALGSYSAQGYVKWPTGLTMSAGVLIGAVVGAELANRKAAGIVRYALLIVVILLLWRVYTS